MVKRRLLSVRGRTAPDHYISNHICGKGLFELDFVFVRFSLFGMDAIRLFPYKYHTASIAFSAGIRIITTVVSLQKDNVVWKAEYS